LSFRDVIEAISLPYFALFVLAAAAFAYLMIRNKKLYGKELALLITTLANMGLMCSERLWRGPVGQFFSFFQSTARLIYVVMALILIFVAMTAGLILNEVRNSGKRVKGRPVLLVIISLALVLSTRFYIKFDFYNQNAYVRQIMDPDMIQWSNGISCGEWLPEENIPSECFDVETARANDMDGADGFKHDNFKYFEVWVDLAKEYYDMPYIYYYGYRAYLLDENENPISELIVGEAVDGNGYVRVFMPKDGEGFGHMLVQYQKTRIQKSSYVITGLTSLAFVCWMIINGIYDKYGKEPRLLQSINRDV